MSLTREELQEIIDRDAPGYELVDPWKYPSQNDTPQPGLPESVTIVAIKKSTPSGHTKAVVIDTEQKTIIGEQG